MKKISLFLFALIILSACADPTSNISTETNPVKIAISKAVPVEAYHNYIRWIHFADSNVVCYDMYHLEYDSAIALLKTCDGLLLTGGTDIYPGRYGKESDTARCWTPDFKRDSMEINLFRVAYDRAMPIMGICRGLQLTNVALGGSLYIDIPEDLDTLVKHQLPDTYNAMHEIKIKENSLLAEISGLESGVTNSNHHQGIDAPGDGLLIIANTIDSLPESIELIDRDHQYLLGVQWHPERMDYSSPLSGNLAVKFINEAKSYKKKQVDK